MTAPKHQTIGPASGFVKVTFQLEQSDWHQHATETMWAEPLGEDRFRLKNVPFYAYGISYDDVIVARKSGQETLSERVIERSGHSTYRIFVTDEETLQKFPVYWASLEKLACTQERATERLFSVDVPPDANIYEVYAALERGEAASVWDFEEGHMGHALGSVSG